MARGEQFRKPGFLSSGVLSSAFNKIHTLGGAWLMAGWGCGFTGGCCTLGPATRFFLLRVLVGCSSLHSLFSSLEIL